MNFFTKIASSTIFLLPSLCIAATYQCDNYVITEDPSSYTGCVDINTRLPYTKREQPTTKTSSTAKSNGASQFSNIEDMIDQFNDYSKETGTFEVIQHSPLHIRLSPQVVPRDFPEVIEDQVRRALVYGVYRTFVHTPFNEITVTAVPQEFDFKTRNKRLLSRYSRTVSTTRAEAFALVKKFLRIETFGDLVTTTYVSGMAFNDQWISDFNRLYYNDQGYPGLRNFVGHFSK